MSHVSCESAWKPTIQFENLKKRAAILAKIRQFFADRDVLEVETQALSHATITDPYIHSMIATCHEVDGSHCEEMYLQTSPEFAMKRLLAAGSGSIYQICKAFRNGEIGSQHNPEFTMLEWYRIDFDHHDLMQEMDELFQFAIQTPPAKKISYQKLFEEKLKINPHIATAKELENCAIKNGLTNITGNDPEDRDMWMQLLMSEIIEPQLKEGVFFIYDYPATQAALARIRQDEFPVAERFEAYINGIELANGFHELADAKEQRTRFENDLIKRAKSNYPSVKIDENFLAALANGFPNCSGVAVGIDRLVMIALKAKSIRDVICFPYDIA